MPKRRKKEAICAQCGWGYWGYDRWFCFSHEAKELYGKKPQVYTVVKHWKEGVCPWFTQLADKPEWIAEEDMMGYHNRWVNSLDAPVT